MRRIFERTRRSFGLRKATDSSSSWRRPRNVFALHPRMMRHLVSDREGRGESTISGPSLRHARGQFLQRTSCENLELCHRAT